MGPSQGIPQNELGQVCCGMCVCTSIKQTDIFLPDLPFPPMATPHEIKLHYMEKCVSPYTFICPRFGVSPGCRLCSFRSSSWYILGKPEQKDFKLVMFSGAERLTKSIWCPLYGLLPWSTECNLGIRWPTLFLERVRATPAATSGQPGHRQEHCWRGFHRPCFTIYSVFSGRRGG